MPGLSRSEVEHVARLARLDLSEEDVVELTEQLGVILDHEAHVSELDTHDVPPTAHPLPLVNVLRGDTPRASLDRDEVLAMAPDTEDSRFRVPRILDAP
jgi:aspartyl-tRNA(Asn)/glutamyl-tRNA(Gln) amidotransferase subunit C